MTLKTLMLGAAACVASSVFALDDTVAYWPLEVSPSGNIDGRDAVGDRVVAVQERGTVADVRARINRRGNALQIGDHPQVDDGIPADPQKARAVELFFDLIHFQGGLIHRVLGTDEHLVVLRVEVTDVLRLQDKGLVVLLPDDGVRKKADGGEQPLGFLVELPASDDDLGLTDIGSGFQLDLHGCSSLRPFCF